uniref:Uncharacterized protein n=1 Tax=Arundo donax TaxID=35708 RepID=A0A0A8YHI4_ARUDO
MVLEKLSCLVLISL